MLLLFFSGARSGTKPTPPKKIVGWPDTLRRRVPRKYLENLLQIQKDNTFGHRWFEEFEAAQRQFAKAEAEAAVRVAAQEAREAARLVETNFREREFRDALREVALTLEVTKQVTRTKDIVAAAQHAERMARALRLSAIYDDDEEIELLLMQ